MPGCFLCFPFADRGILQTEKLYLIFCGNEDIIGTLDLFSGKTHSDHNLARGTGYAGGDSGIYRIFRKG